MSISFLSIGFFLVRRNSNKGERFDDGTTKHQKRSKKQKSADNASWRYAHTGLGALVLALGFVNISLGVFLAVLPLPVWIIWFIYLGFLVLILVGTELAAAFTGKKGKSSSYQSSTFNVKREDPRGKSQQSLPMGDDEREGYPGQPKARSSSNTRPTGMPSTMEPHIRENPTAYRTGSTGFGGDDMAPLITHDRQTRPGDVTGAGRLPDYHRPNQRGYPMPPRRRSGPAENAGIDYYEGYGPEPVQGSLSRPSVQQQNEHSLTPIRLQ